MIAMGTGPKSLRGCHRHGVDDSTSDTSILHMAILMFSRLLVRAVVLIPNEQVLIVKTQETE